MGSAADAASAQQHIQALPVAPSQLGESPFWWPEQGALYWCDISGHRLHRWTPQRGGRGSNDTDSSAGRHDHWAFDTDIASAAPFAGGRLLLALRSGLFAFDPKNGERERLQKAPYDTALQRFNDGKCDPQGRFWVATLCEPREPALAALYRWWDPALDRVAGGISVGNGIAWSPDGRTLYCSDTHAHRIWAHDFDTAAGELSNRRTFAEFPPKAPEQNLADYGGRPDGAAVDVEGCYWVAMYEGQRLLRLAPDGSVLREVRLPVRCPTMPCFGGADLRTLYVTTARRGRPEAELAAQPLAGCVLTMRVDVPGLPVNFAAD